MQIDNARCSKRLCSRASGFSVVELLVVIGTIGVLLAMLVPATQVARSSARRAQCANHLRQLTLALQEYEAAKRSLPIGAEGDGTYRFSWWVHVLPFLGEGILHGQLDDKRSNHGLTTVHLENGRVLHDFSRKWMFCPASPLPELWPVGARRIAMPQYTGVAGAANDDDDDFAEDRVAPCCSPKFDGEISAGGLLTVNQSIRLAQIRDGTSNTLILGEISDYALDADGTQWRNDSSFHHGFQIGANADGPVSRLASKAGRQANPFLRIFNITTVRYRPNSQDYHRQGVYHISGPNNPFSSAHTGGVNAAHADGSVIFVSDDVELRVLKGVATRDDGESRTLREVRP